VSFCTAEIKVENPTHEADRREFFTATRAYAYAIELVELGFAPSVTVWDRQIGDWRKIAIDDLALQAE
jgi:hypothetical protein